MRLLPTQHSATSQRTQFSDLRSLTECSYGSLTGFCYLLLLSLSKGVHCNIFMHKDACNLLTLGHCVYRQPNYFVNMLFVGVPLLPEGRSARFVHVSQGNCVQPGTESLRLVVQRQVLTRNKQQASTSLLL
jgi:hypothetical protein